jgi:hypothetical protein
MPSHAEPSQQATCRATTKAGAPCRKLAVADGLCLFHSGRLDLAELGRRGGKARGKKQQPTNRLEALATSALEELLSSGSATARVQAAKFALASIGASSTGAVKLAKKALAAEYEAERQQAMAAARQKLARLIDARAEARAQELYAERMKLEAGRRAPGR